MIHDHTFPAAGCTGEEPFGSARDAQQAAGQPAPPAPAIPTAAMADLAALRAHQIHHFGHTPASDCALPLRHLPQAAMRAGQAVQDDIHFKPAERTRMRAHALKAASLWLAFADRLDAEPEGGLE